MKSFLVLSLTETMSACFDSGDKIHTWLLENAIHEAFDRAHQARDAQLRALYAYHGGRPFSLINFFGFIKMFRVTLRAPDIIDNEFADKSFSSEDPEEQNVGVTVEELHNALSSVNVDVLERHPALHTPSRIEMDEKEKKAHAEKGKPDHYALTWNPGASLAVFEDFAKTWGSLKVEDRIREDKETRQPDDELINSLLPHHMQYTEALAITDSSGKELLTDEAVKQAIEQDNLPLHCDCREDVSNPEAKDPFHDLPRQARYQNMLEETYAMMQEEIAALKGMVKDESKGIPGGYLLDGLQQESLKVTLAERPDAGHVDLDSALQSSELADEGMEGGEVDTLRLLESLHAPPPRPNPESDENEGELMNLLGMTPAVSLSVNSIDSVKIAQPPISSPEHL
jgi:hypothetical protein